jgi:pantoate--beta-alanine ligase
MEVYKTIEFLQKALSGIRKGPMGIGFIPTMGALHQGHLSLIDRSIRNQDIVVSSIYVNPSQFNDPNDLINYPRNTKNDLLMLESAGCKIVFVPGDEEMYPVPDTRTFEAFRYSSARQGLFRAERFSATCYYQETGFGHGLPD